MKKIDIVYGNYLSNKIGPSTNLKRLVSNRNQFAKKGFNLRVFSLGTDSPNNDQSSLGRIRNYLKTPIKDIVKKLSLEDMEIYYRSFIYMEYIRHSEKLEIFLGIQRNRNTWKGTDLFEEEILKLIENYKHIQVMVVSDVAYEEYVKKYSLYDILLDQLYSYSPAMNALTSMFQGKVVVSGGELEMYQMLNETKLSPIINFTPKLEIRNQLEKLLNISKAELEKKKMRVLSSLKSTMIM